MEVPPAGDPGNPMAIAALVLGILSIPLLLASGVGGLTGIVAIVLGAMGMRRVSSGRTAQHRGLALAGLVLGIVTVSLAVLFVILGIIIGISLLGDPEFRELIEQKLQQEQGRQR